MASAKHDPTKNTHFKQNNENPGYSGRANSDSIVSEHVAVDVESKSINDNIQKNIQNRGHLGNTAKEARGEGRGAKADSPYSKGLFCWLRDGGSHSGY